MFPLLVILRPTGYAKTVYQTQRFAYERQDDERCDNSCLCQLCYNNYNIVLTTYKLKRFNIKRNVPMVLIDGIMGMNHSRGPKRTVS